MLSGSLQTKPNTGDQFYRVLMMNYRYVIASVSKNDGSGDNLTVNVYQDGTLITTDSTSIRTGTWTSWRPSRLPVGTRRQQYGERDRSGSNLERTLIVFFFPKPFCASRAVRRHDVTLGIFP